MLNKIEVIQGDITHQKVDAIVNAANTGLLGGGGVDGAIHRAAGPKLLEACRPLGGCETGSAKITQGFDLSAKWVIHTVGPVWNGGKRNEDEKLAGCYQATFSLVLENSIQTVAFPSISTGVYRFPIDRASKIALFETKKFLEKNDQSIQKIIFVCFDEVVFDCYQKTVKEVFVS